MYGAVAILNRLWVFPILTSLSAPVAAEQACVKYHKCVSLDQFKCEDVTRSSFVERVCYVEAKRYMVIKLKGTYYHYCEIGPEIVAELLTAPSLGQYYNSTIKSANLGRAFD